MSKDSGLYPSKPTTGPDGIFFFTPADRDQTGVPPDHAAALAVPGREEQDFHRRPGLHFRLVFIHGLSHHEQPDESGHAVPQGSRQASEMRT